MRAINGGTNTPAEFLGDASGTLSAWGGSNHLEGFFLLQLLYGRYRHVHNDEA